MGYITLYQDTEVDIYLEDIIDNLSSFNNDELIDLKEEVESKLNSTSRRNENVLEASTLDEEYKIRILREMFNKFSWEELEDIKKKIM